MLKFLYPPVLETPLGVVLSHFCNGN